MNFDGGELNSIYDELRCEIYDMGMGLLPHGGRKITPYQKGRDDGLKIAFSILVKKFENLDVLPKRLGTLDNIKDLSDCDLVMEI